MRHRKRGRKLGRNSSHRKAMFKNMARSLIEHERIITTAEKAKECRPFVEKLITLSKENNTHNYRLVADRLRCSKKFDPAPAPVIDADDEDEESKSEPYEPPTQRWDIRVVRKLFNEIGPRFKDRPGGYTRILRLPHARRGDGATQVIFELVEAGYEPSSSKKKSEESDDSE